MAPAVSTTASFPVPPSPGGVLAFGRPLLRLADAVPAPPGAAQMGTEAASAQTKRMRKRLARNAQTQRSPVQQEILPCAQRCEREGGMAETESLRTHFAELDDLQIDRIFLVRKVQQFGLDSASVLQAYFGAYGVVERVLVTHSPVLSGCKSYVRRVRASNMAIVVMARAEMAELVHLQGVNQRIEGRLVLVERYERRGDRNKTKIAMLHVPGPGVAGCEVAMLRMESTTDGSSSGTSDHSPEDDSTGAFISDEFEYWSTDDECYWGKNAI